MRLRQCVWIAAAMAAAAAPAAAQKSFTWDQVKTKFETVNPTLRAAQIAVNESRAAEITAYLRPNPDFTFSEDGTQLTPNGGVWRPFQGTQFTPAISYLHERQNKRELRLESARKATAVASSGLDDEERNLFFNLRTAFVETLLQKAVLALANENLEYYDRLLGVSSDRFKAGDIAQVDLDRLQLQRVQFETDQQTALVNLRTAKIQLQQLLNDRTPVEQFDVTGPFEYAEPLVTLEELRQTALANRPDLREAIESIDLAKTNYQLAVANGSTDPTWSVWATHNPSFQNPYDNNSIGASVSIPLRIFDRNQGEKARTQMDIQRNERLREAAEAQVFNDVDSAFAVLNGNVTLLRSYKASYLAQATRVRDTVSFAYQHGGSSLLDFLNAQSDYRSVQLNYLNLVGAYLTAAGQLNMAVGVEVVK